MRTRDEWLMIKAAFGYKGFEPTKTWSNVVSKIEPIEEGHKEKTDKVYKRLGMLGNEAFIAELIKVPSSDHTETRDKVLDARFAKFRAQNFIVNRIWNITKKRWETKSVWNYARDVFGCLHLATYTPNMPVCSSNWEPDQNVICGGGIHYFLSLEGAYLYDILDEWISYTGAYYMSKEKMIQDVIGFLPSFVTSGPF